MDKQKELKIKSLNKRMRELIEELSENSEQLSELYIKDAIHEINKIEKTIKKLSDD